MCYELYLQKKCIVNNSGISEIHCFNTKYKEKKVINNHDYCISNQATFVASL